MTHDPSDSMIVLFQCNNTRNDHRMNKAELIEKILRLDEEVYFSGEIPPGKRASIVIVGASALLLCDLSYKQVTKDVDVLEVENTIREFLVSDGDFNTHCSTFARCLPYNYEDRLVKMELDTYIIDVFVPSIEDITVMKLYRWEKPDVVDLTSPEFLSQLNWDLLDHLITSDNEAIASRIAELTRDNEFKSMLFNYDEYKRTWKK